MSFPAELLSFIKPYISQYIFFYIVIIVIAIFILVGVSFLVYKVTKIATSLSINISSHETRLDTAEGKLECLEKDTVKYSTSQGKDIEHLQNTIGKIDTLSDKFEKIVEKLASNIKDIDHHKEKLGSMEKNIESMQEKINSIHIRVEALNPLFGAKSPISITPKGQEVIDYINANDIFEKHKEAMIKSIEDKNPSNAYDIQQEAMRYSRREMLDVLSEEELLKIKDVAFQKGLLLEDVLGLFGIMLRDAILKKLNIPISDVDKFEK